LLYFFIVQENSKDLEKKVAEIEAFALNKENWVPSPQSISPSKSEKDLMHNFHYGEYKWIGEDPEKIPILTKQSVFPTNSDGKRLKKIYDIH
jgi:hypothetical protein